jgi:hypothetical protein
MLGDPANFIDPDGRAGIPFLQDFMKSDGGFFLEGLASMAGLAGAGGAYIGLVSSLGGIASTVVSVGLSVYSAGSTVKNMTEFASEGSSKTYAKYDFSADFSMMKSSRHAGMAFEGAANESNGDPKKKDPKTVTIYSPSDNLKTNTAELEHKFLSSLYYQEPQGPSAWARYKQDEISIPQLISEWENSFDQTMMEFWQVGAYMLPSTGLSVAISGQDLLGNEVGVGMRVFSGVTSASGFGFGVRSIAVRASITTNVSKPCGRIFYVGEGAESMARYIASQTGYKTVYNTWYGALGQGVTPFLSQSCSRWMWVNLSAKFANGAKYGDDIITVFGRHQSTGLHTLPINSKSVWKTVEFQILQSKGIHYRPIFTK